MTPATEVNTRVIEFARCQPVLRAFGRTGTDYEPLGRALATQHGWAGSALWLGGGLDAQRRRRTSGFLGADRTVHGSRRRERQPDRAGRHPRACRPVRLAAAELAEYRLRDADGRDRARRITSILGTPALPETATAQPVVTPRRVQLDHVRSAIRVVTCSSDVSFVAEPGTMTALVGPSGSGKTTITRLIARFYDVDCGVVRVGGVDVRDQSTADLMAQLSLVFQDVYLFDDTLWQNIRIGRPDASDEDVEGAARTAGLMSVVERLPDGWQTRVGEGGVGVVRR